MILYQVHNSSQPYNLNIIVYDDFRYVPHLHRDFELVYVMEGEVSVSVDKTCETLREGDFALILQNRVHSYETEKHSRAWVCVFAEEHVRDFAALVKGKSCASCRLTPDGQDRDFLRSRLVEAHPYGIELSALLSYACALFYKSRSLFASESPGSEVFHGILRYINGHFREDITQRQMAKALGYEPHYLSRYLNGFFGKNFRSFVNEYRINYAKELLADPERTISQIAMESGFQSVRSFNRAFSAVENEEPRQARKRLAGRAPAQQEKEAQEPV